MDNKSSWSSCTFELEDIEIIDHKNENEEKSEKWNCDQCSLFFLEKAKLNEHKKKHVVQEIVKCKYCNKTISSSVENRQCFLNRKCETCEYKCSKCPQRFLRRSSLMNHEKKHSSPKKKRATIKNKKVNGICTENVAVSKVLKKKQIQTDYSEEHVKGLKTKKSGDSKNSPKKRLNLHVKTDDLSGGIDNSPIKKPKRLSLKASKSTEETSNSEDSPVKVAKPKSQKSNQLSEEKKSEIEHIQKTSAVNSPAVSQTANMSSTENAVNYKPFSCHICGDTFASDSALIDHIKTHGENAARSFRCKFCGDEFDDIYKMQYHLAICPLAEDELESSLKQVLPANIQTKYSGGTLSPRKRGRPKKIVESPLDQECIENESTPSSSKRGNFRKRKSEVLENEDSVPTFTGSSLPKQSKNSKNKDSNRVAEEDFTDTSFCDITEVTKETEPDERKKLHQCPFPRCDFKFTREKALLCHMRNHSDDFEDSLKCHKCDIPFDDIQTLRLHINTCKGIKEERDDDFDRGDCFDSSPNRTFQRSKRDFVCNQCGRSHQSQEKLNSHQCIGFERESLVKKALRRHKCNVCQAEFQSEVEENNHMVTHIRKVAEQLCLRCFNYFNQTPAQQHKCGTRIIKSLRSLIELSICHTNPSPKYILQMFDGTHSKPSVTKCLTISRNLRVGKSNGDQLFLCRICKLSFGSRKMCLKHRKSHEGKAKIPCSHCNRKFSSRKTLQRHDCKYTKKSLLCSICSKEFYDRMDLTEHLKDDHVKEMKKFECDICNITMNDASAFIDHLMFHTFSCSVDKENSKHKDTELDLDSYEDKNVDRYYNLSRNETNPTRKLGRRPSFNRNKMTATFAISKTRHRNGFHRSPRVGKGHVTTRREPNQILKCKDNIEIEKDSVQSSVDSVEPRNKENIPENSLVELTENPITNLSEPCTDNIKNHIKPCYIPLVNMNVKSSDSTYNFDNALHNTDLNDVAKNEDKYIVLEQKIESQLGLRCIKKENDYNNVISVEKDIKFGDHGDIKSIVTDLYSEPKIKSETIDGVGICGNNGSEVVDDSVVIVDDLKVYRCSLCSEIFDSVEPLRNHVVVHL